MSQPKFAVGEVVILQSKTAPELNGEYQILRIVGHGEKVLIDGVQRTTDSRQFGYGLGVIGPEGHGFWCESSLKKRHQPGEYTWEGLKTVLSMPVDRCDLA